MTNAAQPGRAIVPGARRQRRAMECVDLPAIVGHEREVKMRRLLVGLEQAQGRLALRAKLDAVRRRPLRRHLYAERLECREEERLARRIVADAEFHVVEHRCS
ncbi:hypothetical protein WT15_30570 [Burkholderia stagnalis]|nr:hypothetical protein WT74_26630 [Burkholderia stagnalis]KVN69637.1 hypothetical protein WT15_30570 [Burkholderia stagnalis]KWO26170.1 hypothetical protein WT96_32595 [Burkholderia stagnalis]KWO32081.1 hypothetical protein WT95_15450 [Burkholderia stagnalis]